ncbi:MAG: tetratricopeptide repeat protein, partial [Bdellovibrionales bacterium]
YIFWYLVPALMGLYLLYFNYESITEATRGTTPRLHYFYTQLRAYVRYIAMYFVSYDLNADNLQFGFSSDFLSPKVLLATAINLLLICLSLYYVRLAPYFTLGLFWFYIGISPASSFVVLAEPVNDHRAFIGYFGLAMPIIVGLDYFLKKYSKWAAITLIVIIASYSLQTFQRSKIWQSNQKVWIDTVEKNKDSVRALNNLAADYMGEGRNQEAQTLLQQCLQKSTTYAICYINLAVVSSNLGFDELAEQYFSMSINIDDTKFNSRFRWALFLIARGFIEKPIQLLEEADRLLEGLNLDTRLELIKLYVNKASPEVAKKLWQETLIKLGPQASLLILGRKYNFTQE